MTEKKAGKAKPFLRAQTRGGTLKLFSCNDPEFGGILGQLSGQGYIKRDEGRYILTQKGERWLNPEGTE